MPPLGSKPRVVEVEPANHRSDIERALHGVELVACTGDARAVLHRETGNDWAEQLGAGWEVERLQPTTKRVEQAVPCGLVGKGAGDLVITDVVNDVDED